MSSNFKNLKIIQEKRLQTILFTPSFSNKLSNANFQIIVEKQLDILAYIEKKLKITKKKSSELLERYNQITQKKYQVRNDIKVEDENDLQDQMNYLLVYVKNIFKIDLDTIEKPSGKTKPNKKEDVLEIKQQPDEKNSQTQQANFNQYAENVANMFSAQGPMNIDPHQNPLFAMQAQSRLKVEIASGNVYVFKSKPKLIPIIKLLTICTLVILGILQLIIAIFVFMSNGYHSMTAQWDGGQIVYQEGQVSTIWNGIMFLLITGCLFFTAWWLFKPLIPYLAGINFFQKLGFKSKNKPNDNKVYNFMWQIILILVVFFALSLVSGMIVNSTENSSTSTIFNEIWRLINFPGNESKNVQLLGWYYSYIVALSLVGVVIIEMIIGSVLNPKQDTEKLNALVNQYIDEIIASSGANRTF